MTHAEIEQAVKTARVTIHDDGSMGFWLSPDYLVAAYPSDDADTERDYDRAECIREARLIRAALAAMPTAEWYFDGTVYEGTPCLRRPDILGGGCVIFHADGAISVPDNLKYLRDAAATLYAHGLHETLYRRARNGREGGDS